MHITQSFTQQDWRCKSQIPCVHRECYSSFTRILWDGLKGNFLKWLKKRGQGPICYRLNPLQLTEPDSYIQFKIHGYISWVLRTA